MSHIDKINKKIQKAISNACYDALTFTDDPSKEFNAEYLFTVSVAKAICELNGYHGDPYKIFIEKKTKLFARDCLLPIIWGRPLKRNSSIFRKELPNIERYDRKNHNGRIDVAVYYDFPNNGYVGEQPLCAIELKGFNPQRSKVLDDLKRNLAYFRISGETGRSVISFTSFSALYSFNPKKLDEEKLTRNEQYISDKYNGWLSELGNLNDINTKIETFTVSKELVGTITDEIDYKSLDLSSRHHFVGVIVTFMSKEFASVI